MAVYIGYQRGGKTYWLIDACSDCEVAEDKGRAHDFKTPGSALRGAVLFLKDTLPLVYRSRWRGQIYATADCHCKSYGLDNANAVSHAYGKGFDPHSCCGISCGETAAAETDSNRNECVCAVGYDRRTASGL